MIVDFDVLAKHLLDRWPTAAQEDELEASGGELPAESFPIAGAAVACSFRADENGDTYALISIPLPGHWTTDDESAEETVRLRFYGGDLLPDPR